MSLFDDIVCLLEAGERVVSTVILSRSGSAPRVAGTRMFVRSDGSILGTIGGGILEARVVETAREVFSDGKSRVRRFTLASDEAGNTGMICGGAIQVLISLLDPADTGCPPFYRAAAEAYRTRKRGWMVMEVPREDTAAFAVRQGLLCGDGSASGCLEPEALESIVALAAAGAPDVVSHGDGVYLVEPLCHQGTVFIFGAGHVSQKLAPLAKFVGFRTVVVDDRAEFANRERFPDADEILVPASFESAMTGLDLDVDAFVVLVTRGHAHDRMLLGKALRTGAGYIGMIGSRRKRDGVYESLRREGFKDENFERVHSPVGLDIGAESPEEIAVSIVAELIRERAGKRI